MAIVHSGYVRDNEANAIACATAQRVTTDTCTAVGSAVLSNACGYWTMTTCTQGLYDVTITSGSNKRRLQYKDEVQLKTIETATLKVRNPADTFTYDMVPAAIVADRTLNLPLITGSDTLPAIGLAQTWSAIQTHSADIIVQDASDVALGSGSDALLRWSTGDADNHALVLALGQSNQVLHITEACDVAVDWNVSANAADSEVWIHSSTSAATDYLVLGRHTGTVATIDVQGGTTLNLDIAGNTELTVTASGLNLPANSDINFTGTTGTNDIVLTNALADALSITDGSADIVVIDTSTSGNVITLSSALAATTGTFSGILKTDDATEATTTTDGSLQTDGGLSVVKDAVFGDDVFLLTDSAVLNMGAGSDFTITHDGTTGATLAGNPITITSAGAGTWSTSSGALTITSAAAATWSTAAGVLTIDGDDGITLQTTGSGNVTVAEILDITDATDASNATGDTGALRTEGGASIAKKLYVGTDLDVDGTTNLDAVDIDGNVQLDGTFTVGVDDTGQDVKFFGATSGAYFLYDESADGIVIDQSTDDGNIMEFRSSTDVAHPFTGSFNAAMYGSISKDTGGSGGLTIIGIQDAGATSKGIVLYGFVGATAADTAKSTSAAGIVHVLTRVSDGSTGGANPGSNENLMTIAGSSTRFIFDTEGSGHADVEWVAYDSEDDIQLLDDIQRALLDDGSPEVYDLAALSKLGIVGEDSFHYENGKPRAMINWTKMAMLHHGAIRKVYADSMERIDALTARLEARGVLPEA